MKTIIYLIVLLAFFSGCNKNTDDRRVFGQITDTLHPQSVQDLLFSMKSDSGKNLLFKGRVLTVSQKDGSWFYVDNPVGSPVLVRLGLFNFSVPKDISGRTVIIQGRATTEKLNVETLRRMAFEAGKSNAEIQGILKPQEEVIINASGIELLARDGN